MFASRHSDDEEAESGIGSSIGSTLQTPTKKRSTPKKIESLQPIQETVLPEPSVNNLPESSAPVLPILKTPIRNKTRSPKVVPNFTAIKLQDTEKAIKKDLETVKNSITPKQKLKSPQFESPPVVPDSDPFCSPVRGKPERVVPDLFKSTHKKAKVDSVGELIKPRFRRSPRFSS